MALPKITQPEFEITLPVIKRKIKFRPFLVKEEKVLLIGKEGSPSEQMAAMMQILKNVVVSPKNFNPGDLTVTDIEYLFMHLRGKSVDNIVKLKYQDKEDEKIYDFEVDLNTISPTFTEGRKHEIPVGNVTVELKDPTFDIVKQVGADIESAGDIDGMDSEKIFDILSKCLVKVWDNEQVYDDFTEAEAKDFFKGMDIGSFKGIQEFFETSPKLQHTLKYTNELGNERTIVLKGISDFF